MHCTRFPVGERDGCITLLADGSKYFWNTTAEKKAAMAACQQHAADLEVVLRDKLGRPLTDKEFMRCGVEHKDNRRMLEKYDQEEAWKQLFAPPKPAVNPNQWERLLAEHLAEQEKARDPKAYEYRQLSAKWQAEQAEKQRKAELAADPRRQEVVKKLTAMEVAIKWDERADASEVYEIENLTRLAREGDLEIVRERTSEFQKNYTAKLKELAEPSRLAFARGQIEVQQAEKMYSLPPSENVSIVETSNQSNQSEEN